MSKPVKVTDGNFSREVLRADKKVLVDFWAEWCGPCRMVAPVVEDIAREYSDQIKVAKLNVDENQSTASRYGIMSIPTMLVMEDGKVKDKLVGYMPKDKLAKKLGLK
ncbi:MULTISPECIES: thioredoxin [Halanaerobium]|jgi:thioredoxin 1|uniref:Thioredoxin n=1 Tax=Halanaerobium kushneri TaxID=56779 RepID=A0A1N6SUF2_9FIRM|nr:MULTISPECIES: thioredoxin [Halanaerobium]RCW60900.1 thioredoxin [Halanaerobium sp. ST460_2HS_T2]SIQ44671.1 thioredoxin [Halanaerobium kushneri]